MDSRIDETRKPMSEISVGRQCLTEKDSLRNREVENDYVQVIEQGKIYVHIED